MKEMRKEPWMESTTPDQKETRTVKRLSMRANLFIEWSKIESGT